MEYLDLIVLFVVVPTVVPALFAVLLAFTR
jgi:hypothetical protein